MQLAIHLKAEPTQGVGGPAVAGSTPVRREMERRANGAGMDAYLFAFGMPAANGSENERRVECGSEWSFGAGAHRRPFL